MGWKFSRNWQCCKYLQKKLYIKKKRQTVGRHIMRTLPRDLRDDWHPSNLQILRHRLVAMLTSEIFRSYKTPAGLWGPETHVVEVWTTKIGTCGHSGGSGWTSTFIGCDYQWYTGAIWTARLTHPCEFLRGVSLIFTTHKSPSLFHPLKSLALVAWVESSVLFSQLSCSWCTCLPGASDLKLSLSNVLKSHFGAANNPAGVHTRLKEKTTHWVTWARWEVYYPFNFYC